MQRNSSNIHTLCQYDDSYRAGKKITIGVLLVLAGIGFMLERAGYIASMSIGYIWPLLFCVFGLTRLVYARSDYDRARGFTQIFLGFWFFACFEHLWGWTFATTWPMILIAVGLCYIIPSSRADQTIERNSDNGHQS